MSQSNQGRHRQRRRHYRIEVLLALRLRDLPDAGDRSEDEVTAFEELSFAAARFRKELGGPGRTFVDKLMATLDALTGQLVERNSTAGWCPRLMVEADLSAGGMGFVWERYQAPGSRLEIEFWVVDVGSSVPFRLRGSVIRCPVRQDGGYDVGIEFDEMSAATQQRLVRTLLDLQRIQLRARAGHRT